LHVFGQGAACPSMVPPVKLTALREAAIDPDLSDFKANGGKMVLWHGWDDPNIAPRNTSGFWAALLLLGSSGASAEIVG